MKITMIPILEKSRAPSRNVFCEGLGWRRTWWAGRGRVRLPELTKLGFELRPLLIRELDGGVDVGNTLRWLGLHVPSADLVQLAPECPMGIRALGELAAERHPRLLQQEILEVAHCSHTISSSRYWITTIPSWRGYRICRVSTMIPMPLRIAYYGLYVKPNKKSASLLFYGLNLMNSMIKKFGMIRETWLKA